MAYPEAEQAGGESSQKKVGNGSKTRSLTGIKDEGRALQIEGERDPVGSDSNTLADTVMIVNFVPVVCQFVCGGQ